MGVRRICMAVFLCVFLFALREKCTPAVLGKGSRIPAAPALKDIDGNVFPSDNIAAGRVLVCFFSVYAEGAADQADLLDRMTELARSTKSGVRVIGINVDPSAEAVRNFADKQKTVFTILLDRSLELSSLFHVRTTPTFYFLESGKVAMALEGYSLSVEGKVTSRMRSWTGERGPAAAKSSKGFLLASGARQIRFSPTEPNRLFYLSEDNILWSFDVTTRERSPLVTDVASFDVSPDGESVVFEGKEKGGIWIRGVDRGSPKRASGEGKDPVWSPQGNLIAYLFAPDQVWVYDIAAQKRWRVAVQGISVEWSAEGGFLLVRDAKGRDWLVPPSARYSVLKSILH